MTKAKWIWMDRWITKSTRGGLTFFFVIKIFTKKRPAANPNLMDFDEKAASILFSRISVKKWRNEN